MRVHAVVVLLLIVLVPIAAAASEPPAVALSMSSSAPVTIFAQDVTFTVTTDPPITADLTLVNGRIVIGTVNVVDGVGTWTSDELPAGNLGIQVLCGDNCVGDPAGLVQTIDRAGVVIDASIDTPLIPAGGVTRINVNTALMAGEYTPRGLIDVSENGIVLATTSFANGTATLEIPDLDTGEHLLNIRYYGNKNCYDAETTLRHTVRESLVKIEPAAVNEGNDSSTPVTLDVRLTGRSSHAVDVEWKTADATAVAGRDYEAAHGTLTFNAGETVKQIAVNVIGNKTPEQEKSFNVVVTGPQNESSAAVRIINDDPFFEKKTAIPYGTLEGQTLDLYLPLTGNGPYPVIIGVEAVDFITADPGPSVAIREAERGYIVAKPSIRPATMPFPAQVNDMKAVVRWLRAHATEYGIDPSRIGVWGIGAGGHLATLLGTTDDVPPFEFAYEANAAFSSRVQAVVDWYGQVDLTQLEPDDAYDHYLGCAVAVCPEVAATANPASYATADDPPLLMMHGANDLRVPVQSVLELYFGLQRAGVDARLSILPDLYHGGNGWNDPSLLEQVDKFFDEKLKQ